MTAHQDGRGKERTSLEAHVGMAGEPGLGGSVAQEAPVGGETGALDGIPEVSRHSSNHSHPNFTMLSVLHTHLSPPRGRTARPGRKSPEFCNDHFYDLHHTPGRPAAHVLGIMLWRSGRGVEASQRQTVTTQLSASSSGSRGVRRKGTIPDALCGRAQRSRVRRSFKRAVQTLFKSRAFR